MIEPRYTYKAAGPCFSIENETPFVLKGCSCGWPSNSCRKYHGRSETDRAKSYVASIEFHGKSEPQEGRE